MKTINKKPLAAPTTLSYQRSMTTQSPLILAIPKGRILEELTPLLAACDIIPEPDFSNKASRKLRFKTNQPLLEIIRVRAFDVATIVAYGGAHIGVVGSDVLEEFNYDNLYTPLDLEIGGCRLSLAAPEADANSINFKQASHIRVATKYPHITETYFANHGVQAECIKLNGAMEIAPDLGMAGVIVDLVSTGDTLKANKLQEIETILNISSRLIINRNTQKTRAGEINGWIKAFQAALKSNT